MTLSMPRRPSSFLPQQYNAPAEMAQVCEVPVLTKGSSRTTCVSVQALAPAANVARAITPVVASVAERPARGGQGARLQRGGEATPSARKERGSMTGSESRLGSPSEA